MNKSVILEQAEIISPLGRLERTVHSLLSGVSAIRPGPCFGVNTAFAPFADERYRILTYAAPAVSAGIDISTISGTDTIFINCMAKGDIHCLENAVTRTDMPVDVSPLIDSQARIACKLSGITPKRILSVSNACASGAVAVEMAIEMLQEQRFARAVIFGLESMCRFVTTGFNALSALSPEGARPFDALRNGLTLGEAAAIAVLKFEEPLAKDIIIAGAGSSNDANHRTGPSRTGDGLYAASVAACEDAAIDPADIGAVKCHGTATVYNDAMEAKAIYRLFKDNCPPCVSLKGAIGHTSGAGSLVEIIIASQLLKKRLVPPTAGYSRHGVDENIAVLNQSQKIIKPSVICLSAGFGGLNSAVILKEAE